MRTNSFIGEQILDIIYSMIDQRYLPFVKEHIETMLGEYDLQDIIDGIEDLAIELEEKAQQKGDNDGENK